MVADSGPGTYTMRTVSTFVDLGDGRTEVVIEQSNAPAEFLTPENQQGFLSSLDELARYLVVAAA